MEQLLYIAEQELWSVDIITYHSWSFKEKKKKTQALQFNGFNKIIIINFSLYFVPWTRTILAKDNITYEFKHMNYYSRSQDVIIFNKKSKTYHLIPSLKK